MKCETIKLLQDNTGEDLDALSLAMTFFFFFGNDLFDAIPKARL